MTQHWHILNIDRKEKCDEMSGELGWSLWHDFSHMPHALTIVSIPQERIDELLTTGSTALQRGPLGKLPPELLGLIFDALPEFRDIIFLCLTCKLLLDVGQRRLQRVTRESFAPWAGCRLVCLGDLSTDTKLPAGLLTDAEKQEIETKHASIFDDYESEETRVYQYTTNFYKGVFGNPWMDDPRIEYWHGKMAIRRPLRKLRPP